MDTTVINIIIPPAEPVNIEVTQPAQPVTVNVTDPSPQVEVNVIPPENNVAVEVTEVVQTTVVNVSSVGEKGDQGPPGTSGSLDNLLFGESPIGIVDGSNATFTTPLNFVPGKIEVFINGLLQKLVTHYQTTGVNTIIFNDSPQIGDIILLNFIKP